MYYRGRLSLPRMAGPRQPKTANPDSHTCTIGAIRTRLGVVAIFNHEIKTSFVIDRRINIEKIKTGHIPFCMRAVNFVEAGGKTWSSLAPKELFNVLSTQPKGKRRMLSVPTISSSASVQRAVLASGTSRSWSSSCVREVGYRYGTSIPVSLSGESAGWSGEQQPGHTSESLVLESK